MDLAVWICHRMGVAGVPPVAHSRYAVRVCIDFELRSSECRVPEEGTNWRPIGNIAMSTDSFTDTTCRGVGDAARLHIGLDSPGAAVVDVLLHVMGDRFTREVSARRTGE